MIRWKLGTLIPLGAILFWGEASTLSSCAATRYLLGLAIDSKAEGGTVTPERFVGERVGRRRSLRLGFNIKTKFHE